MSRYDSRKKVARLRAKNLFLSSLKNKNMSTAEILRETYRQIAKRMCEATGFAAIEHCVQVAPTFEHEELGPPFAVLIVGCLIIDKSHPAMQDPSILGKKWTI